MQALKLWRASVTGLLMAEKGAPSLGSCSLPMHEGIGLARREATPGWRLMQCRKRGLLRKEARAQLQEEEAKSCLVLSPVDKVSHRPGTYNSMFPCPRQSLPPRTEHMVCLEDGYVVDLVSKSLDLPPEYVEELVHFGAIYQALVCPPPPKGSLTPLQWELYKKALVLSHDKKRPSLKGKTIAEAQKTVRITSIHEGIEAGSYLRVHVHLKRYPRCYEVDWKSRVITNTDSYVVLDKPAGVPVGQSLDNIIECCALFTARALGLSDPLRLTHQLDNCTEGCLVLAKTKEFSSEFHLRLRNKEVKKYYLVLVAAPVPLGMLTHYMCPGLRHPKVLSPVPLPGWVQCQLEILECREVPWPAPEIEAKYHIQDMGWEAKAQAYECKVQLLTGRTHQVRAQFAALRAPLVGDAMYMPAVRSQLVSPEIYPFPTQPAFDMSGDGDEATISNDTDMDEKIMEEDGDEDVARSPEELKIEERVLEQWVALHGSEPECAIGLQASEISWDDGACSYKANDPWWR